MPPGTKHGNSDNSHVPSLQVCLCASFVKLYFVNGSVAFWFHTPYLGPYIRHRWVARSTLAGAVSETSDTIFRLAGAESHTKVSTTIGAFLARPQDSRLKTQT